MNYVNKTWIKPISGILSLFFLVALFSGCNQEDQQSASEEALSVQVQTASTSVSAEAQTFPGRVESDNQANLSTIVMGTVTGVPVSVGENVKKDDVLVRIKDDQILAQKSQLEANMVQAKANLENTEKNYNRIKNLYAEESATSKELDDISTMYEIAKANMEALEARLNEVNEMLAYTTIRAPFDGIVARKFVSEGDMAAPGHPLIAIADPSTIKITASVPEKWIGQIENGQEIHITVASAGIQNVPATLSSVSDAGDPMSRQFAIEARITDSEIAGQLKTGMFAQISMNLDQAETLFIPKTAIVKRGQLTGVYTLSDANKAVLRWVRTGQASGNEIEILSGLKTGEQYVAVADQSIRQGQLLSIR
ncbi:MAG: efflux RND transporter periplasmic adaptor subunit [Balneolaceae bacterium]|nr:efflux RND transporter periplasmic adaptor subunit [Balneolaceae bacterium]